MEWFGGFGRIWKAWLIGKGRRNELKAKTIGEQWTTWLTKHHGCWGAWDLFLSWVGPGWYIILVAFYFKKPVGRCSLWEKSSLRSATVAVWCIDMHWPKNHHMGSIEHARYNDNGIPFNLSLMASWRWRFCVVNMGSVWWFKQGILHPQKQLKSTQDVRWRQGVMARKTPVVAEDSVSLQLLQLFCPYLQWNNDSLLLSLTQMLKGSIVKGREKVLGMTYPT